MLWLISGGGCDASAFLAAFTGSHRYVLDYLSDEVLARQPAPVQQFLLHTCILERLSGPLCDAVREQAGSQAMLEALERANLFVVALDDERGWYRYHHLFAQVLRSHLQQREPTLPPVLHRRASAWYEQHELPAEAVQHALAVPDAELAASLIELIALTVALQGQISTVLGWMNALPEALVRTRPRLCVYYALLLIFTNQFEAAEELLQQAEQGAQELSTEEANAILGYVLAIRAGIAGFSGTGARARRPRGLHAPLRGRGGADALLAAPGSGTQQRARVRGYALECLWEAGRLRCPSPLCSLQCAPGTADRARARGAAPAACGKLQPRDRPSPRREREHGQAAHLQPLWQTRGAEPHAGHHSCQDIQPPVAHRCSLLIDTRNTAISTMIRKMISPAVLSDDLQPVYSP